MEGEARLNSGLINAHPISILVVDDDTTCLAIVAAKLKRFQYRVVTVKHPNDALCTLRIKGDAFDLVVSDVHMPEMNGIQLQQVIAREFNLPVVLMSADKKQDVIVEGLGHGAAFYIAKPVSTNDLKDLWQFAITKKKRSNVVIEETGCITREIVTSSNKTRSPDEVGGTAPSTNNIAGSTSSVDEVSPDNNKDPKMNEVIPYNNKDPKMNEVIPDNNKDPKTSLVNEVSPDHNKDPQTSTMNEVSPDNNEDPKTTSGPEEESSEKGKKITETAPQKKQKIIWTNALHDRFLDAVMSIGLDRAVPKKILEVMNVPNLTRENVASHLQKYRIFLRRVTEEANLKLHFYDKPTITSKQTCHHQYSHQANLPPPVFTPSTRTATSSSFLNNLSRRHNPTPKPLFSGARKNGFFPNRGGSSSNIQGQSGYGQSRLLSNGGSLLIPNVAPTSRTTDIDSSRLMQNMYQNITSVQGNISGTPSSRFGPVLAPASTHLAPLVPASTHFDPLAPASATGVNLVTADYGVPNSCINYGFSSPNFNSLPAPTSTDYASRTNYVGLNTSNVQHFLVNSAGKQPACDVGIYNLTSELEFQNTCTVGTGLGSNENTAINVDTPAINVDEMEGDLLCHESLAARSQMLMESNVYKETGNVEKGIGESSYDPSAAYTNSPMFDLDELIDLTMDQECDNFNPNNPTSTYPIMNLQNQVQDYDDFPAFGQALNTASTDQMMNVQNQDYDNVYTFDQVLNAASTDPIVNVPNVQNYDYVLPFDQVLNDAVTDPIVNGQNHDQNYDNVLSFDQVLNDASTDPIVNGQNHVQNYDNVSFDQVLNDASTDPVVNGQNHVQNYDNVSFDQVLNKASTDPILNGQNHVQNNDIMLSSDQALNGASTSTDPKMNVQNQVQNYGYVALLDQGLNQGDDDDIFGSLLGLYDENPSLDGI